MAQETSPKQHIIELTVDEVRVWLLYWMSECTTAYTAAQLAEVAIKLMELGD